MGTPKVKNGWRIHGVQSGYGGGHTHVLWARNGKVRVERLLGEWDYEMLCLAYGQSFEEEA